MYLRKFYRNKKLNENLPINLLQITESLPQHNKYLMQTNTKSKINFRILQLKVD